MKIETLLEEIKDTATEGSELDDKLEECTECLETMIGHTARAHQASERRRRRLCGWHRREDHRVMGMYGL